MRRKHRYIVTVLADPIPGWNHQPEDVQRSIQGDLDKMIPHYKPVVQVDEPRKPIDPHGHKGFLELGGQRLVSLRCGICERLIDVLQEPEASWVTCRVEGDSANGYELYHNLCLWEQAEQSHPQPCCIIGHATDHACCSHQ